MGSLPKFRGNLVVFACALLFVVVMIFGNEGSASVEDRSAAAGSQGLEPPSSASSTGTRHDVVLALGKAKHSNRWFANDEPTAGPSVAPPLDPSDDTAAPSSDSIQIHQ